MPLKYNLLKKIITDLEFSLDRSKGSHFRYKKNGYGITIPYHKELPPKTSKSILKDIARIEGMSYEDLINKYNIKI